jgi:hypothetical protein
MQQHNAISELHLVPLEQQRTFCVGTPGEPGLPADDRFARYANSSYNLKCVLQPFMHQDKRLIARTSHGHCLRPCCTTAA